MRTILFLISVLQLTAATAASAMSCPFDAAKTNQAVQTALAQDLLSELPYWNQIPPSVSCKNKSSRISCIVKFSAKDGTPFYLDNSGDKVLLIERFSLVTDDEGNYTKPLTCASSLDSATAIYNQNTGIGVGVPIWAGSSTSGDPIYYAR